MTEEGDWRLYPRLLLRRAGFPIDLLMDLGDPSVESAAAGYRTRAARLEELREQALTALRREVGEAAEAEDRDRLRLLSKVRGRVGRRRPLVEADMAVAGEATDAYTAALRAEEEAWESLHAALDGERAARSGRVRRALDDEQVQDALVQLAPSFAAEVERWSAAPARARTNAKDRAFLRRAYLYCQRLGAKNETTSFFGPLIHGSITPDAEGIELSDEMPSGVVDTEAFLAFWAVCALARTMAEDPLLAGRFAVSWIPACRYHGDGLTLPDGRRAAVTAAQRQVLDLVDGNRTPADIARLTGLCDTTVLAQLDRLQRAGAVRFRPEPPSTAPRPLGWLIALADRRAADTDWPDRLRRLDGLAALYAEATGPTKRRAALEVLEAAFQETTGAEARRAAGQMYADRLVVSVDAKGDQGPVKVAAATAADWERELTPVLDVAAHYGELLQSACAELCADLLREAGVTEMPYDELIRHSQAAVEQGRLASYTGPADTFAAALTEIVANACQSGDGEPPRAVLDPGVLMALRSPTVRPRFVSPDLMLESGPGERSALVLGELHPYVFAWGSQGLFDDEQDQTLADFGAHLEPWGGPQRLATVIRRRRHKGLVAEWFPGRFVEITAVATEERDRALPVTQLVVELVEGKARLRGPDGGEIVLYAGEDDHVHLRAFAAPTAVLPPVRLGDVMPRWGVGDLIAQRARWWVTAEELGTTEKRPTDEVFRSVQRMRARLALPRLVFAHVPGEPKPIGADLDSPLAVEALAALVTSANTDRFTLTEMRPAPDQLWLHRQGRPVTSEFRLALRWEMR
ncbi:lantibiotic dehydratase [Streptomyces parvus]|uniref:Lantibiotic dehydratase n=1 Tax=Streptomyces parvus TaxID=66428 RepID=A0A5D4JC33_9ACTN|nr:lantibiotic dehydratase [Streptomyces parvus]TYR62712.1 lantibiotic dehydratase [Streptomyces parvus]